MTTNELITLLAIVVGPVIAVIITLWIEGRRRDREQKLIVLRLLISTRHLPSDPGYGVAINLIPVEFSGSPRVMHAYKEFIEASSVKTTPETAESAAKTTATKNVRLIYEVARSLGFDIRETDIEYGAYASQGWVTRDTLLQDSQRATRDLVNILILQTRLMANAPLNDHERALLGADTPPEQTQ